MDTKKKKELKTELVRFLLTKQEKESLLSISKSLGLTPSKFLRKCISERN